MCPRVRWSEQVNKHVDGTRMDRTIETTACGDVWTCNDPSDHRESSGRAALASYHKIVASAVGIESEKGVVAQPPSRTHKTVAVDTQEGVLFVLMLSTICVIVILGYSGVLESRFVQWLGKVIKKAVYLR